METEKRRKYDVLANKLGSEYRCETKVIAYVMTWDGIVTSYHKRYCQEIGLSDSVEAYIQGIVLKKTLESITFERRRGDSEPGFENPTHEPAATEAGCGAVAQATA